MVDVAWLMYCVYRDYRYVWSTHTKVSLCVANTHLLWRWDPTQTSAVAHSSRSTEIATWVSGGRQYSVLQASVWPTLRGPLLCDAIMQYPMNESHAHTQNKDTLGQLSVQKSAHHCFTNCSHLSGLHTVQDALVDHNTTLCSKHKGLPVW